MGNCSSSSNRPLNRNNKNNTNNVYKNKPMKDWTVQDVYHWLSTAVEGELLATAKKLKKHKINGSKLIQLTTTDLDAMDIPPAIQQRLDIFRNNQLALEPIPATGPKNEKPKCGSGTMTINSDKITVSSNSFTTKNTSKQPLNILNNVQKSDSILTPYNDENKFDQINAENSVSDILQENHTPIAIDEKLIATYGTNGKGTNTSQSTNNSSQSSNNNSNTHSFNYSTGGNFNGGLGSNGGGGGGGRRPNNWDEKKNYDYSTDRLDEEEEEEELSVSMSSVSTLNPYARSYCLDPVTEESESDEKVRALHALFRGEIDLKGPYNLKYFSDVINEAQGMLNDIEKSGGIYNNLTSRKKGSKNLKVPKNGKNKNESDVYGYKGIKSKDAKSQFKIVSTLTREWMVKNVRESMSDYYMYVYKCITLGKYYDRDSIGVYSDGEIFIIHLDLHCKSDGRILYAIGQNVHNIKGYSWKLENVLKTKDEIRKKYEHISDKQWPKSIRESEVWKRQINAKDLIQKYLNDKDEIKKIIAGTPWHRLSVFKRRNNKERNIKAITKNEFQKKLNVFYNGNEMCNLIPIVMFNNSNENDLCYEIHYVCIVEMDANVHIGISYKYNNNTNKMEVSGIHLDKILMYEMHQLISPGHMSECKCFESFKSNISYLEIGNCDAKNNLIKQLQKKNKQLKDENEKLKLALSSDYDINSSSCKWSDKTSCSTATVGSVCSAESFQ